MPLIGASLDGAHSLEVALIENVVREDLTPIEDARDGGCLGSDRDDDRQPEGVAVMTDISRYLDFVLTMFLAFGFSFEVPIATLLLVRTGAVTVESLVAKRPYIIVGAFVVGMVLSPPDVISQTLLAVPMWLLFELGILLVPFIISASGTE